jgi:acyl-CoA thioester hydrolase
MRACGGSYRELEEAGVMMPVVEVGVRYIRPAHYDDLLTIVVRIEDPPGARMTFTYNVLNEEGETLATGHTVLAFMDAATRRPCRPPNTLRRLFSRN